MTHALPTSAEVDTLARTATLIRDAMESVISGRPDLVRYTVAVLLAEGHLLIEDVPGVGKTTLAKALAASVGGTVGRIQFTPDLLPSDLTGVTIYRQALHEFEFRPGPVFANIVIGDEINRASPKTQSALRSACRSPRRRSTGRRTPFPSPSSSSRRRTPSRWRGPTRCPRRSGTASWPG